MIRGERDGRLPRRGGSRPSTLYLRAGIAPRQYLPAGAKAGGISHSQLIAMEPAQRLFRSIALATDGTLSEGSGRKSLIVRRGVLYTPRRRRRSWSASRGDTIFELAADMGPQGRRAIAAARAAVSRRRSVLSPAPHADDHSGALGRPVGDRQRHRALARSPPHAGSLFRPLRRATADRRGWCWIWWTTLRIGDGNGDSEEQNRLGRVFRARRRTAIA